MAYHPTSDHVFERQYAAHLPQLYRVALVATGSEMLSDHLAADAFLSAMQDTACVTDARQFELAAMQRLCKNCRSAAPCFDPLAATEVGLSESQAELLSRCTRNERLLIALCAMLELDAARAAAALGWPVWLTECRLRQLERKLFARTLPVTDSTQVF